MSPEEELAHIVHKHMHGPISTWTQINFSAFLIYIQFVLCSFAETLFAERLEWSMFGAVGWSRVTRRSVPKHLHFLSTGSLQLCVPVAAASPRVGFHVFLFTQDPLNEVKRGFYLIAGSSGVIGAIDCTCMQLVA